MDIPPQNIVTKDSITIGIDSFVSYRIIDPQKAVYAVEDLRRSIQSMVQTTMRNYFSEIKDIAVPRDLKEKIEQDYLNR